MGYVSTNYSEISTSKPIRVFFSRGELVSGPYPIDNDITPNNILEVANNTTFSTISTGVVISDLGSNKYNLREPILIVLQQEADNEYVVSFPEAEISRSGETAQEALEWLKLSMVKLYELYKSAPRLGPLPTKQLRVLENYLVKKPHSKA